MNTSLFKMFSNCILGLACMVVVFAVAGEQGLLKLMSVNSELRNIELQNHEIETQIFDLQNKIYAIKYDNGTLERVVREELGLAKPDEMLYTFK